MNSQHRFESAMQGTRKRSHVHIFVLLERTPAHGRLHGGGGKPSGTLHMTFEPEVMIKPIAFEVTALNGYLSI